jgi:hypothetical protein
MRRKLSTLLGVATLSVGMTALAGGLGMGAASASIPRTCTIVVSNPSLQIQQYSSTLPGFAPVTAPNTVVVSHVGCTGTESITVVGLPTGVTGTVSGQQISYSGTPAKAALSISTVTVLFGTSRSITRFDWANEQVTYTIFQNAIGCTEIQWSGATCPTTGLLHGQTTKIIGIGFPPGDTIEAGECNADAGQTPPLGANLGEVQAGVWAALVSSPVAQCTAPSTVAGTPPYLVAPTLVHSTPAGVFIIPFHVIEGQLGTDTASNCPTDQPQTAVGVACILAAADVSNPATFDSLLTFNNPLPPIVDAINEYGTVGVPNGTTPCTLANAPCVASLALSNPGATDSAIAGALAVGGFSTFGIFVDNPITGAFDANCQSESSDTVTMSASYYSDAAETNLLFTGPTPWAGLGSPPAPGGVAWTTVDTAAHPGVTTGGNGDPGVCNAVASDQLSIVGWGPAIYSGGTFAGLGYTGCTSGFVAKADFSNWLVDYATTPAHALANPQEGCIVGNATANAPSPPPLGNSATSQFGGFSDTLTAAFAKGGAGLAVYGGKFTLPHFKVISGVPTAYPALGQFETIVAAVVYPRGVTF